MYKDKLVEIVDVSIKMNLSRPTWAEVNLKTVKHNLQQIRGIIHSTTKIIAVVKADAYGHGAVKISQTLLENKIDYLAVAGWSEAKELQDANIKSKILILGWTPPEFIGEVADNFITQTIYDIDILGEYIKKLKNKKLKIHLKVDTGMNRLGIFPQETLIAVKNILKMKNIELEGIFTHFSSADSDRKYTMYQFLKFKNIIHQLNYEKIEIPLLHCCNSAATIKFPSMHFNAVRPGIAIYGMLPFATKTINLIPAMSLKSKIISVKEVGKGEKISYNGTFITQRKSKIATVPIGYADGYSRHLSNCGEVLIQGRKVKVVGNVCMDFIMVDVTNIKDVNIGDEVILIGEEGRKKITADEIAKKIGTINYEITCLVKKRVPRVYIS